MVFGSAAFQKAAGSEIVCWTKIYMDPSEKGNCWQIPYMGSFLDPVKLRTSVDPTPGEAVVLMRRAVAEAVIPVGWPRVSELLANRPSREFRRRTEARRRLVCWTAAGRGEAPMFRLLEEGTEEVDAPSGADAGA
jgi:hypothetical protein